VRQAEKGNSTVISPKEWHCPSGAARGAVVGAGWLLALGLAAHAGTLWQIGQRDNSTAEFALAPADYRAYRAPGFFVVGESDPKRDWPYVQPGTIDGGWAPGTPQTAQVRFGLQAAPTGDGRLILDFADTHAVDPPVLRVEVNEQSWEFQTPKGAGDASVFGDPAQGREHVIEVTVPATALRAGENRVAVTTLRGSWVLWDALCFEAPAGTALAPVPPGTVVAAVRGTGVLVERAGRLFQPVALSVTRIGPPCEASVQVGEEPPVPISLKGGPQTLEVLAPDAPRETPVAVTLAAGGTTLARETVTLKPVRRWEVYILMHSHVDIGYTHIQPEIAQKQAQNVTHALELIQATRDFPQGARFKWNLEVLWPYEQFLAVATAEQRAAFDQAVRAGSIGVDAMYANLLTGLCRGEELVRQFTFAAELGRRCGVGVDSMMISDVPGLTWGVVPALAQSGVKYISAGPNAGRGMEGDRIGYVRVQWEHRPFYWLSPSGREKVLYWGAQGGYSFGHHYPSVQAGLPHLLQRLVDLEYPYDIVQLRWSKGDNGPADEGVMPAVRDWNATHAYPKLIVATTGEAFRAFEKRYGETLPTYRGDLTPYWEDGAPSSARETGLNRGSADRLSQAEALWAMRPPAPYPAAVFAAAWKNVAMYSEHTWGAHNSIHQPDVEFVQTQWRYKQAYALDADRQSRELLSQALPAPAAETPAAVDVFNTASWPRTDLVTLPSATRGDVVRDGDGHRVPSQRLSSGELVFLASDVPAFGARRYRLEAGAGAGLGKAAASGTTLTTPHLAVTLDPATGVIASLRRQGLEADLADGKLNEYLYLPGGNVRDALPSGPARVTVQEPGPLVASLRVESNAPGCRALVREVRVVDGLDRVEIANLVDKLPVRAVEGVHFGFAFNVPQARVRMNSALAVAEPEKDQLPGACKNWFSVERWVDVANDTYGVTWATVDAPLVEMGGLTANLPRGQPDPNAYLKTIEASPRLYSWVMNNHWHTNYRADQEGPTTFRYAIRPHAGYDPLVAHRFGIESTQPLLVVPAYGEGPAAPRLRLQPHGVVATTLKPSADGKGLIVRLFAASGRDERAILTWTAPAPRTVWRSNALEEPLAPLDGPIGVAAWEVVTIRVEP